MVLSADKQIITECLQLIRLKSMKKSTICRRESCSMPIMCARKVNNDPYPGNHGTGSDQTYVIVKVSITAVLSHQP